MNYNTPPPSDLAISAPIGTDLMGYTVYLAEIDGRWTAATDPPTGPWLVMSDAFETAEEAVAAARACFGISSSPGFVYGRRMRFDQVACTCGAAHNCPAYLGSEVSCRCGMTMRLVEMHTETSRWTITDTRGADADRYKTCSRYLGNGGCAGDGCDGCPHYEEHSA